MRRSRASLVFAASLMVGVLGAGCASSTESPTESAGTGAPPASEGTGDPPASSGGGGSSEPPSTAKTCNVAPVGTVVDVSVAELKKQLDSGEALAVIDVREPSETAQGTIEGALLYPRNSGVLEAKHAELPSDRPLYVICRSGSRSSAATAFLAEQGHSCVHDVQGGMNAWGAASYPTTK